MLWQKGLGFHQKVSSLFASFWQQHPLFYLGCSAFLGSSIAIRPSIVFLLPFLLLFYPVKIRSSLQFLSYFLFLLFALFTQRAEDIIGDRDKAPVKGTFKISSLQDKTTFFQKNYFLYKGTLQIDDPKEKQGMNIPCSFSMKKSDPFLRADRDYLIEGDLVKNSSSKHQLKIKKAKPVPGSFSFSAIRYSAKQFIKKMLLEKVPSKESRSLLQALLIGDIEDRRMTFFFQKMGLQHILAISGFHFALLAAFLQTALGWLFSRKVSLVLLLLVISSYAFLIGPSPSVLRAWITISLYFIAILVHRRASALNILGAALLIELSFNPVIICDLGFQLSFICTFAILSFYPIARDFLARDSLQKDSFLSLSNWQKHLLLVRHFFQQATLLTLSVHVFALPVLLFVFQKFPLISLVSNLFVPVFVSISYVLLWAGVLSFPVPYLSTKIHLLNSWFTNLWLELLYRTPPFFDRYLRVEYFPFPVLVAILTMLFFIAVLVFHNRRRKII